MSEEIKGPLKDPSPELQLNRPELKEEAKVELSNEQQFAILSLWNSRASSPPSLKELVTIAWGEGVDSRSTKGRAVRDFLASRQLKPKLAAEYVPVQIKLTEEQKAFVIENARTMKAVEMARILFNNPNLHSATAEVRAITAFIDEHDKKVIHARPDDGVPDPDYQDGYKPPKSFARIIPKINEYAHEGIDSDNLTARQKKNLQSLIGFLHTKRFISQINSYSTEEEKKLFESSFIKWVWDKAASLTQENADQYIILAIEVVISHNIQKTTQMLQLEQNMLIENGERMSMVLVEAINTARKEYNESVNRQQRLFKSLEVERSERMSSQIKENASILNLVAIWKDEDSRRKMIRYQQMREQVLKNEIKNYMDMSEVKARILGIGENEILNG
jgi:hypothetical protein